MILRFTRGKESPLENTLTFLREDGSCTYVRQATAMMYHDLLHYAVEMALGYREAFLGLVAAGRDINAFGTQNSVKENYTPEELWAEEIVGVLQAALLSGIDSLTDAALWEFAGEWYRAREVSPPPITSEQFAMLRASVKPLFAAYQCLAPGETLELTF